MLACGPGLALRGAGSKISFTNSSRYQRENYMAENGQLTGTFRVKSGMAQMLKGGVIMDVVDAEQARIAEEAGAVAVMALERVPADIRADGGVARMSDPEKIVEIQESVTIPVMAKARIGHFVEAQILEALEVDYIDESEVLTPADEKHHIDKAVFDVPFVCGATNLGEALRRTHQENSDEGATVQREVTLQGEHPDLLRAFFAARHAVRLAVTSHGSRAALLLPGRPSPCRPSPRRDPCSPRPRPSRP